MNFLRTLVLLAVPACFSVFAGVVLAQESDLVSRSAMTATQGAQEASAHAVNRESTVVVEIPRTQWCQCVRGLLNVEGGDLAGCVKSGASEEKLKIFRQRGEGSGSSATVSSLLAFAGCSESENRKVGSLSFEMEWHGQPITSSQSQSASASARPVAPITCEDGGISAIQATLYRYSKAKLASIKPWDCLSPIGTLNNIPTGSGIRFVITGKNASGAVLFRGEQDEITITYGQKTALGTVAALPFVPVHTAPEHAALLGGGSIRFAWTAVPGATAYQLQVSDAPGFSRLVIDTTTATASYRTASDLASNTYSWRVKATDAFNNTGEWSTPGSITVDAEPPTNTTAAAFINKGAAATNVSTVSLVISAVKRTGVTSYAVSERSKPPEASRAGWVAIPATASYTAEVPYTLSKGDGNKKIYVWFKDAYGHVSREKSGSILFDTKPPQTTITSHPLHTTNSTTAEFTYASTKTNATLHCQLDDSVYAACAGTKSYEGLPEGPHTFSVKAIDAAGNTDLVPANFTWTIDRTTPDTTITNQPPVRTDAAYARFVFLSSKPGSTFLCQIDGAVAAACTSPLDYPALSVGQHSFRVIATDAVGNADPTAASYTWTIAPPFKTTITDQPSNPSNATRAGFSFASTWPGATYRCRLDKVDYAACASPLIYAELAEGSHTFSVKALDEFGNEEVAPAQYSWVISLPPVARSPKRFINSGKFPGYITDKNTVKLTLAAFGTKSIVGYYASESPDKPDADDPAWIGIRHPTEEFSRVVPFTMTESKGTKTAYVWFKDVEGNISEGISDTIYLLNARYVLLAFVVLQVALLL